MIGAGNIVGAVSGGDIAVSAVLLVFSVVTVLVGGRQMALLVRKQERQFEEVLHGNLLLDFPVRLATVLSAVGIFLLAAIGYAITESVFGAFLAGVGGCFLPSGVLRRLKRKRLAKLEEQLVTGIQTLASAVRAGLNMVQAMTLVARDGPKPLRQEFAHLMREYEYGMPLEEAMDKSALRIGSGDFRLLFSALRTHRERGGDLGETLDRIGDSIREIQRLENRVKTLTAQGRANARMLSGIVAVTMLIFYMVDPEGVRTLFITDLGKIILAVIILLNVIGFLWIKKIISIDI